MAAAALDACRMLDRLGLFKQQHQSAREKKVHSTVVLDLPGTGLSVSDPDLD
jgi:hypothetical protein